MLNGYTLHDLQMFASLLVEFEGAGCSDVRFIRQAVADKIHKERARVVTAKMNYRKQQRQYRQADIKCPSCGSLLFPVGNSDGEKILGCRNCRYSRLLK